MSVASNFDVTEVDRKAIEHFNTNTISLEERKKHAHVLLREAARAIEKFGFGQYSCFGSKEEGLSLLGAMAFIATGGKTCFPSIPSYLPQFTKEVKELATSKLQEVCGETCLLTWNSAPKRTKEEAIEVFKKAAASLV